MDVCESLNEDPSLTKQEFKNLYFVSAFDCMDQEKKINTQTTNLQVLIKRRDRPETNVDRKNPRYLDCYMIVLEDRFVKINAKNAICSVHQTVV